MESTCAPAITKVTVKLTGCDHTHVMVYGCSGYCKSDTSIDMYQDILIPKCNCCKPRAQIVLKAVINCPRRKRKTKSVTIYSATRCECYPCARNESAGWWSTKDGSEASMSSASQFWKRLTSHIAHACVCRRYTYGKADSFKHLGLTLHLLGAFVKVV